MRFLRQKRHPEEVSKTQKNGRKAKQYQVSKRDEGEAGGMGPEGFEPSALGLKIPCSTN